MKLDYFSIEKARLGLEKLMVTYVRNEKALKKELPTNDFFTPITKQEQRHPFFDKLLDKDGFFTAAKSVIEELSFHFEDRDGNFVNQFQSLNGFDARIWELYLWCYFREENFHFSYDFDAPDFMIEKMGYEVAIEAVRNRLGIEIVDIPLDEVLTALGTTQIDGGKEGALLIYEALRKVVDKYQLKGFTLRCFDLLSVLHNTGCLALARLNAEGLVAGCEGDVPAMLSMMVVRSLFGISGFQCNPAHIDVETGEMMLAHCTIPLDMVTRYELDTHFESGIGVGIRGYMPEGPVTLFKVSGDLTRHFVAEGQLLRCEARPNLCRTQAVVQLSNPQDARYFLTHPIGNHHILLPGHHASLLSSLLS